MKNKDNLDSKKEKKVNIIKELLARLREKLASENIHPSFPSKSIFKKTIDKPRQPKKEGIKVKPKEVERKEAKIKVTEKRKPKEAKKKEAIIKVIEKRKAKEAKKKADIERNEEEERKEEEAKKKEQEAKRPYEEELEEQLSEEEITGFLLEKTDMDKMCNRVCEIIADYESDGILQSQLWKKFKLSSRDGSRLALKLERMGMITREKILLKGRWTFLLIII